MLELIRLARRFAAPPRVCAVLIAALCAAATPASAQSQDAAAVRERLNRIGSDLFSPTPHAAAAVEELKAILAVAPDSPEAHMLLAIAYRAQGMPDLMGEAVAELRQALALNPELTQARLILARLYLDMARPGRAREELQTALERAPNHPQLLMLLAEAERQSGNPQQAVEISRKALKADPDNAQARYYLALGLLELQQPEAAIAELERVVASGSNPAEANLGLGIAYLETRRFDAAVKVLRESTRADPSRPDAHIQLARAYRLKGLLPQAARELALAAPGTSGSVAALYQNVEVDYHLEEGLLRMAQGRLEAAIQSFQKVLALEAGHDIATVSLAEARKRLAGRTPKQLPRPPR